MEIVSLIGMVDLVQPTRTKQIAIAKIDKAIRLAEKENNEILKNLHLVPLLIPKLNAIIENYQKLWNKDRDDFNESEKALVMKEFREKYLNKYWRE